MIVACLQQRLLIGHGATIIALSASTSSGSSATAFRRDHSIFAAGFGRDGLMQLMDAPAPFTAEGGGGSVHDDRSTPCPTSQIVVDYCELPYIVPARILLLN
jgi:hypothetical protein